MKFQRIAPYLAVAATTIALEILATILLERVWNFGGDIDYRILASVILAGFFSPGLTYALLTSRNKSGAHWMYDVASGVAFQYALAYAALLIIIFPDLSKSAPGIKDILLGIPSLAVGAIFRVVFFPPHVVIGGV